MSTISFAGTPLSTYTVPGTHIMYDGPMTHSADGLGIYTPSSFPFAQLVENDICSGLCSAEVVIDWDLLGTPHSSSEMGLCFIDASRTGFSLIIQTGAAKLRKEIAGTGGSNIATASPTFTGLVTLLCTFNTSSGDIEVFHNASSIMTGNYTDTLTGLRAGIQQYRGVGDTSVNRSLTVDPGSAAGPSMKYWNGTTWVAKPLKYWNGSSWVAKPLKYYNGSTWV